MQRGKRGLVEGEGGSGRAGPLTRKPYVGGAGEGRRVPIISDRTSLGIVPLGLAPTIIFSLSLPSNTRTNAYSISFGSPHPQARTSDDGPKPYSLPRVCVPITSKVSV